MVFLAKVTQLSANFVCGQNTNFGPTLVLLLADIFACAVLFLSLIRAACRGERLNILAWGALQGVSVFGAGFYLYFAIQFICRSPFCPFRLILFRHKRSAPPRVARSLISSRENTVLLELCAWALTAASELYGTDFDNSVPVGAIISGHTPARAL